MPFVFRATKNELSYTSSSLTLFPFYQKSHSIPRATTVYPASQTKPHPQTGNTAITRLCPPVCARNRGTALRPQAWTSASLSPQSKSFAACGAPRCRKRPRPTTVPPAAWCALARASTTASGAQSPWAICEVVSGRRNWYTAPDDLERYGLGWLVAS